MLLCPNKNRTNKQNWSHFISYRSNSFFLSFLPVSYVPCARPSQKHFPAPPAADGRTANRGAIHRSMEQHTKKHLAAGARGNVRVSVRPSAWRATANQISFQKRKAHERKRERERETDMRNSAPQEERKVIQQASKQASEPLCLKVLPVLAEN